MAIPRVPGDGGAFDLPCGRSIDVSALDMGMREFECPCGERHAVVMDMHPLSRFVPEDLVAVLEETIETTTGDPFDTMHMMGVVLEEFPDELAVEDVSENGHVGAALVWVSAFDSRRLHEIVVELVVELMEHAISHAENPALAEEFESQMFEFDVSEFVEQYRQLRDFEDEYDTPA